MIASSDKERCCNTGSSTLEECHESESKRKDAGPRGIVLFFETSAYFYYPLKWCFLLHSSFHSAINQSLRDSLNYKDFYARGPFRSHHLLLFILAATFLL